MIAAFYFVLGGLIAAFGLACFFVDAIFGGSPFARETLLFWGVTAVGAVIAAAPILLA